MPRGFLTLLLATVAGLIVSLAGAQSTELFIPALEDLGPVSVSEIGVGSDGRTTWAVAPGTAEGTNSPQLPVTATLVEGPNDAVVSYSFIDEVAISCAITASIGDCNIQITGSDTSTVTTVTGTLTKVNAALATTAASASLSTATALISGSLTGSGPSQTSSGVPSATRSNGALRGRSVFAAAMGVIAACFSFCIQ
ncbi:hypothetical protein OE88DRAFT_1667251 [Heliocybe sulcata]|uniref:GPI anchored protein n=1 Tax=Heliocybe sulcata TaxID=5364 RepID=A0A5C3MPB9_9AGAM|nr:hypothetical protein OE88DRAFT_1667251 [Heliocybe sulcata]